MKNNLQNTMPSRYLPPAIPTGQIPRYWAAQILKVFTEIQKLDFKPVKRPIKSKVRAIYDETISYTSMSGLVKGLQSKSEMRSIKEGLREKYQKALTALLIENAIAQEIDGELIPTRSAESIKEFIDKLIARLEDQHDTLLSKTFETVLLQRDRGNWFLELANSIYRETQGVLRAKGLRISMRIYNQLNSPNKSFSKVMEEVLNLLEKKAKNLMGTPGYIVLEERLCILKSVMCNASVIENKAIMNRIITNADEFEDALNDAINNGLPFTLIMNAALNGTAKDSTTSLESIELETTLHILKKLKQINPINNAQEFENALWGMIERVNSKTVDGVNIAKLVKVCLKIAKDVQKSLAEKANASFIQDSQDETITPSIPNFEEIERLKQALEDSKKQLQEAKSTPPKYLRPLVTTSLQMLGIYLFCGPAVLIVSSITMSLQYIYNKSVEHEVNDGSGKESWFVNNPLKTAAATAISLEAMSIAYMYLDVPPPVTLGALLVAKLVYHAVSYKYASQTPVHENSGQER